MNLTVESFCAAAMASIQNKDGSISENKDAVINLKTSNGQSRLVSAKISSRTTAQANMKVRQEFIAALKTDSRFAGKAGEIDRLVKVDATALSARKIVSVLKDLTKKSDFGNVLAADTYVFSHFNITETKSGFSEMTMSTLNREDINLLKTLLSEEEQKDYLDKYAEAMYSKSAPDMARLNELSDLIWNRLDLEGWNLLRELQKLKSNLSKGDESVRTGAFNDVIELALPHIHLDEKYGHFDKKKGWIVNNNIKKILQSCIAGFLNSEQGVLPEQGSFETHETLRRAFLKAIGKADTYVVEYQEVATDAKDLVDALAKSKQFGLDAKRVKTLRNYIENELSKTVSNLADGKKISADDIEKAFHPGGNSFYLAFSDKLVTKAVELGRTTDDQFVDGRVQAIIDENEERKFDADLAQMIKDDFGIEEFDFGKKGQDASPVSNCIRQKVADQVRDNMNRPGVVLTDEALEDGGSDVLEQCRIQARGTIKSFGKLMPDVMKSHATAAWQKIEGLLSGNDFTEEKLGELKELFLNHFSRSKSLQGSVFSQVSYLLETPFTADPNLGFERSVRVSAEKVVQCATENCKKVRELCGKGSEKIEKFLNAKPGVTPFGITAEQQAQVRSALKTAQSAMLIGSVLHPEDYNAEDDFSQLHVKTIEKLITRFERENASRAEAYQARKAAEEAAARKAVEEEAAQKAAEEIQQKPVRPFTDDEVVDLKKELSGIVNGLETVRSQEAEKNNLYMPDDLTVWIRRIVERQLDDLISAGGASVDDVKNLMRERGPEMWKAAQTLIENFARVADEVLKGFGVDRLVNMTGKNRDYAPAREGSGIVQFVLLSSDMYIKQDLVVKFLNGEVVDPEEMKRDLVNRFGGENGLFADTIESEKNCRMTKTKTCVDKVLTHWCIAFGCDRKHVFAKTLESVLTDLVNIRLADENKYWMPDEIAEECRTLVGRFDEFRDKIAEELDTKLVGGLKDLPGSERIKRVDDSINSRLGLVREAPEGGKLTKFENILQTSVPGAVNDILNGLEDYLILPAYGIVTGLNTFTDEKYERDWLSGSFIGDLKLVKVKTPSGLKASFDELAKMFVDFTEPIQEQIAIKIKTDVQFKLAELAEKKTYPSNRELLQMVHEIEANNLLLVQNANRVAVACRRLLKNKGVSDPDETAIQQIEAEIGRMFMDPEDYAKKHFGLLLRDDTSAEFKTFVESLPKGGNKISA